MVFHNPFSCGTNFFFVVFDIHRFYNKPAPIGKHFQWCIAFDAQQVWDRLFDYYAEAVFPTVVRFFFIRTLLQRMYNTILKKFMPKQTQV